MSYLTAEPLILATAATDLAGIGSAISEAAAAAASPTTGLLPAAADEVSAAIAKLFGAFGQEYQAVNAQISAFHNEFQQRLIAAANAYANAEATSAAALVQQAIAGLPTPASPPPSSVNPLTALVFGGTGTPIPGQAYIDAMFTRYVAPLFPNALPQGLFTPEQLYPITGVKSLPLATSVQQGLQIMDAAIWQQLNAGNPVTVFGYSQSAIIASLEIQHLISLGPNAPLPSQLSFVFTGNEMNPNGGLLARFPGLNIASIGLPFYGATPDNPYPTTTYTIEYDGFADFPRYPLNFISDLNAVFGILTLHTQYASIPLSDVANKVLLDTVGTTSNQYYIIPSAHLPLLDPVRAIPIIGEPIAALIEPDLRVIVNLGYGDPNYGYSTSPANVPTPFGLFPDVHPSVVADALVAGTQQGINDFAAALPTALTTAPTIAPPGLPPFFTSVLPPAPAPIPATPLNIANTFASALSDAYSTLLPTADLGLALTATLPAYNATLALSQLAQGNLINAIGYPLAATVGMSTLGGMIEFIAVVEQLIAIAQAFQSLTI
ncbi:PE-PPE domain-containing protein [Mycobacterium kubicae]|uniref:PE family protein n=1 Tax=Mycobacterium kubicae TaxID=120959 RepID=UPI00163FD34D|nr:PE-PPE domain-containing protein [Mycobacterium kubicae]QNI05184.1 PE-PPE domain-containing protein [Mycobacterium kubicae]